MVIERLADVGGRKNLRCGTNCNGTALSAPGTMLDFSAHFFWRFIFLPIL